MLKTLVKGKFPWIDTFDHMGSTVINAMCDLTVGVFEYLEITSKIHLDLRIKYT